MIHQLDFRRGQVSYRNRFVRTRCLAAEQEAGGSLWGGLDGSAGHIAAARLRRARQLEGFVQHRHHSCTPASRSRRSISAARPTASIPRRSTRSASRAWAPLDGVSAHPKVDPATGELMFFNYSKHAPYMHYGVVDRNGRLTNYTPIPLPGPRLPHDMAITRASFDPQRPAGFLGRRPAQRERARRAHARSAVALRHHPAARPHRGAALVRGCADLRPALPQRLRARATRS